MLLHDIGSAPLAMMQNSNYPQGVPYTGPVSGGGSFCGQGVSYGWFNEDLDAFAPPFSMECVVWQQADIATQQILMAGRSGANVTFVQVTAGRKLSASSGGGAAFADAANLTLQTWFHVVMTVTAAGALILYKNAVNVAAGASGVPATGNYRWALGGNTTAFSNPLQGAIAEMAVYPAVLTPARVTAHYLALDQVASKPVYRGGGLYPTSTGGTTLDSDTLAAILASVRKDY